MFHSKSFGRIFWVDDDQNFKSCPQKIDGTGDFDQTDYVSDWTDLEGVNLSNLLDIHMACLNIKWNHAGAITIKDGL
tara:strand:+ start:437 stop:667 length:231 start_codon:yes stop_codon:yes gene_type:complete